MGLARPEIIQFFGSHGLSVPANPVNQGLCLFILEEPPVEIPLAL
jgi:hypothetical protein